MASWMKRLLWFVGAYNILAGVGMVFFYHEGYRLLGIPKPDVVLPVQVVGTLVLVFGVGYWLVAANPVENRNILLLGFWSKLLGPLVGVHAVLIGKMPPVFLAVLFLADFVYLPPFALILARLNQLADQRRQRCVELPLDRAA